ncbi:MULTISPECIES: hypothetical protein [Streptomyces]|uniref:Uncharacterized protein n=2 Tax=Streptomyces TaxID=1883 RepID=A0A1E7LJA8_9ACTN|nr:hypothetical protein [Streptomyces nanshensis]OEV16310.1 hypothetical protein AN221_32375 [Streptomyces nanshensis]
MTTRPTARWRILYDLFQKSDVVTYDQAADALGLHPDKDRKAIQKAMARTGEELETANKRALRPVPGVGYRIAAPNEHVMLAREYQDKSKHAIERGVNKVVNVNLNGMDPAARSLTLAVAQVLTRQNDMMARFDLRQQKSEAQIREIVERQDRSDAETAELKERLARLEAG